MAGIALLEVACGGAPTRSQAIAKWAVDSGRRNLMHWQEGTSCESEV